MSYSPSSSTAPIHFGHHRALLCAALVASALLSGTHAESSTAALPALPSSDTIDISNVPQSEFAATSPMAASSIPSTSNLRVPSSATSSTKVTRTPKSSNETSASASSESSSSGSQQFYLCDCKASKKISLMGRADYCMTPDAMYSDKCGNAALGERGECPRAGAQPCQDTGHVLVQDSLCLLDKRDDTYKCVASRDDMIFSRTGRKPRSKKPSTKEGENTEPSSVEDSTNATNLVTRAHFLTTALAISVSLIVAVL